MDVFIFLGLFFGLAAVDSINPSALVATGYLLGRAPKERKVSSVLAYVAGIYCFYFITGLLLFFGFSAIIDGFKGAFESDIAYIIQAIIGVVLFVWSWIPPKPLEESRLHPKTFGFAVLFSLGITITMVEFVTALPYLGAIALLQQVTLPMVSKIVLLAAYNFVFILPPLVMLVLYRLNKKRFVAWQERRKAKRGGKPDDTMQWIIGAVGVLLFLNALSHFGLTNISINIG